MQAASDTLLRPNVEKMPPKLGRPPQPVPFPGVGRGERPLRHRGRGPLDLVELPRLGVEIQMRQHLDASRPNA